jgi:hypothetical protein
MAMCSGGARGPATALDALEGVPGEWRLFAVDQVEAPPSSRLVPDMRERRFSFTNSWASFVCRFSG